MFERLRAKNVVCTPKAASVASGRNLRARVVLTLHIANISVLLSVKGAVNHLQGESSAMWLRKALPFLTPPENCLWTGVKPGGERMGRSVCVLILRDGPCDTAV